MEKQIEILQLSIHHDDPEIQLGVARVLNTACANIFQLVTKTDDNKLKARALDKLPELLALIADEEKQALVIEAVAS